MTYAQVKKNAVGIAEGWIEAKAHEVIDNQSPPLNAVSVVKISGIEAIAIRQNPKVPSNM